MELNQLAALPQPGGRRVALRVSPAGERSVRDGHPWLFDGSIVRTSHDGAPGDLGVVFDRKGRFMAVGLYDPDSPIRLRILHQGAPTDIDPVFWDQRIACAIARRAPLAATAASTSVTDGYRLLHGENDGLPGLVVDRYAATLVMKLYTAAWIPHLAAVIPALVAHQLPARIVLRLSRAVAAQPDQLAGLTDGCALLGELPQGPVIFQENGLRFEAEPVRGQKTGFFLDQRENRGRVEKLAHGKKVLNVFAYNGGFSLYAARGGATEVTSLDISKAALVAAARNFELNQDVAAVAAAQHISLAADAFRAMADLAAAGQRYDLVIVDPPAFAKRQSEVARALDAYRRLIALALGLLAPSGTLVAASCSSRVSADDFFWTVHDAARSAGRPLQELERTGHALDHPIGFPEGAYLKCLFAVAP